jgi:NAD-dependent deacetylase
MNDEHVALITQALAAAERVAALTGAGISAESGVPTFRGTDGLWRQFKAESLATPEAFERDPSLVWEWYNWRRGLIAAVNPNAGHRVLAGWEELFGDLTVITQNVDGLHGKAGSKNLVELHGNIWRTRCTREGTVREDRESPLRAIPPLCPACGALLRPDIVWFGECLDPKTLDRAFEAAAACQVMFVIGTSSVVQPAASLPLRAARAGAKVIEINPERTPLSGEADIFVQGKAGEVLSELDRALRGTRRRAGANRLAKAGQGKDDRP